MSTEPTSPSQTRMTGWRAAVIWLVTASGIVAVDRFRRVFNPADWMIVLMFITVIASFGLVGAVRSSAYQAIWWAGCSGAAESRSSGPWQASPMRREVTTFAAAAGWRPCLSRCSQTWPSHRSLASSALHPAPVPGWSAAIPSLATSRLGRAFLHGAPNGRHRLHARTHLGRGREPDGDSTPSPATAAPERSRWSASSRRWSWPCSRWSGGFDMPMPSSGSSSGGSVTRQSPCSPASPSASSRERSTGPGSF